MPNSFKVFQKIFLTSEVFIIEIDSISDELKKCLDEKFITVCEGNVATDLTQVKKRLLDFLSTKSDSTIEMGAIAEFLIHIFLNDVGFEPQFLFFNLEENSIKKGFDGFYLLNDQSWILESKSGKITTEGVSHVGKVKEGYKDLKDKLAGVSPNNPWRNAYNHACHIDVGAALTVRDSIKKISDLYEKNVTQDISDFNIIPGSTIFLDGVWKTEDPDKLANQIDEAIEKLTYKAVKVVCVTKKSMSMFYDYLNT